MGEPLCSGEGEVIADLDFSLIDSRKAKLDSRGPVSDAWPNTYRRRRFPAAVEKIVSAGLKNCDERIQRVLVVILEIPEISENEDENDRQNSIFRQSPT